MTPGEKLLGLTGIDRSLVYDPGIVTFTVIKGVFESFGDRPLYAVAWKIDDAAWVIRTANVDRISDNDPAALPGVCSLHEDADSWHWGIAPFLDYNPAIQLRNRILRLTGEFGLAIDSFEATACEKNSPHQ